MLPGIDRAAFAVALATRLRDSGVSVGFTAIDDFVRALAALPPISRSRLYWAARVSFVRRHSDTATFDAVFSAVFDDAVLPMDPNARRRSLHGVSNPQGQLVTVPGNAPDEEAGVGLPWATLPRIVADAEAGERSFAVPERLPSKLVALVDVPFEDLSPDQMRLLGAWLIAAVRSWPTRRSRRMAIDGAGHHVALRATIARSRRTGWEPVELVRASPQHKPRRVVMLCDVSQSMQAQATAYLHLMRAVTLLADAEVFAFATTLTRLTTALAHHSADTAITEATNRVGDRFGGTRIATNVQTLLASSHGSAVRGAVVIIGSDGWDGDSPELLAAAMARLHRRAYRVIWMNPRASAPGFAPQVATMAAALPYCDSLLPADTFAALEYVAGEIGRSSRSLRAHGPLRRTYESISSTT